MIELEAQLARLAQSRGDKVEAFDPGRLQHDRRRKVATLVGVATLVVLLVVAGVSLVRDHGPGGSGSGSVVARGGSTAVPTSPVLWLNPPGEDPDSTANQDPDVLPTLPPTLEPGPATLRLQDQWLGLLPDGFVVSGTSETKLPGDSGLASITTKGPGPSFLNLSARTVAGAQPDTDPQGPALELLDRNAKGATFGLERTGLIDVVFLRADGLQLTARLQPDVFGGVAAGQTIADWVPPMSMSELAARLTKLAAELPPTATALSSTSTHRG